VISGFRREVAENCALLGRYAASSGSFLPPFRDNLSVESAGTLKIGPIFCPKTSVRNYQYLLRNDPEERSSQISQRNEIHALSESCV
jgi:hypothetical protein